MTHPDAQEPVARTLKDGRGMTVRLAGCGDVARVTEAHPLPEKTPFPEGPCRTYYQGKIRVYVASPDAGIVTGWVDGELAGFVFYCHHQARLKRAMRSPRNLFWALGQLAAGRFGGPRLWYSFARWTLQHLRSPSQYSAIEGAGTDQSTHDVEAWIGTVHTLDGFRRMGVASELLLAAEAILADRGASEAALWAALDNDPATALYSRRGYCKAAKVGRIGEECWLMVKSLSAAGALACESGHKTSAGARHTRRDTRQPGCERASGTPAAIVTDASERVALHMIRSLGRRGVAVRAVEIEGRSGRPIGFSSRYTHAVASIPSWEHSEPDWLQGLLAAGDQGDVLMPCCLNAILRVVRNREAIEEKYAILLPPEDALVELNDKWSLHRRCAELEIRTPITHCPASQQELDALGPTLEFPVVVKYRHDEDLYQPPQSRVRFVHKADDLASVRASFEQQQGRPLVQQYIRGEGYGVECIYGPDGELGACFAHKRLMEYPPTGGPSAVCESIHAPELVETARKLLESVNWRGAAMVEFKQCALSGEFHLLEVNPRFWGSLPLSSAAGVNFPHLMYRLALGEKQSPPEYRAGVRMRFLPTYVLSAWASFRQRPLAIGDAARRLGYLLDPRVREGLFCSDDLRPAFAYLWSRAIGG